MGLASIHGPGQYFKSLLGIWLRACGSGLTLTQWD